MIVNNKNGKSSYEMARDLGVMQKTAWFMEHRIRLAMQSGSFLKKMSGQIEVDETYIGGKARNMHKSKRKTKSTGMVGKIAVMGLLERHGEVRAHVLGDTKRPTLQGHVNNIVEAGSQLFTDSHPSYFGLEANFIHEMIDHAESYVEGNIHTNGIENFWSLLKRSLKGTYISVEPFHLFRYLDEQSFRFNNRKGNDSERFQKVMEQVTGRRVTLAELTGKSPEDLRQAN
jgi:transposase-like protein